MAQWREGVDTCVFNPAVKCEGEAQRPGEEELPEGVEPRTFVSRIRTRAKAGRDIEVETLIRTKFPKLVEYGSVSVYDRQCVPDYDEEDVKYEVPDEIRSSGCGKLGQLKVGPNPEHVNLITEKFDGEVASYLYPDPNDEDEADQERLKEWRSIIRHASSAAVVMVPDEGPWIIHTDCHLGNVLYNEYTTAEGEERQVSALADWGRTLIIENPKDLASIRQGIREWVGSLTYLQTAADAPADKIVAAIRSIGDRKQHPRSILDAVARLMIDPVANFEKDMAMLRGWMFYALITQMIADLEDEDDEPLPYEVAAVLQTRNKRELLLIRQDILEIKRPVAAAPEGGMYWPAKYFKGLTRKQNLQRKRSATRRTKMSFTNPKAYVPFKSDKGAKTRRSSYTQRFHKKYPDAKTIPEIAKATGISKSVLDEVYNRGMAAWRTGHRPGASQHAWGMARVHSFAMKGKTYRTADADLSRKK